MLVCGAFVGLGFASEENLGYLSDGDLATAMARFLTANFLHMSMTAILAGALDEMVRDGDAGSMRFFSQRLLAVAAMHGVYDFCLSSHAYGDLSYFAMAVFLLLARWFLTDVSWARAKERAAPPYLLETFATGMAIVVGELRVRLVARGARRGGEGAGGGAHRAGDHHRDVRAGAAPGVSGSVWRAFCVIGSSSCVIGSTQLRGSDHRAAWSDDRAA